jgi:hypothetical protein
VLIAQDLRHEFAAELMPSATVTSPTRRADPRDPAKGWAVWMGQRRIGDHLHLADQDIAKMFARIVS